MLQIKHYSPFRERPVLLPVQQPVHGVRLLQAVGNACSGSLLPRRA